MKLRDREDGQTQEFLCDGWRCVRKKIIPLSSHHAKYRLGYNYSYKNIQKVVWVVRDFVSASKPWSRKSKNTAFWNCYLNSFSCNIPIYHVKPHTEVQNVSFALCSFIIYQLCFYNNLEAVCYVFVTTAIINSETAWQGNHVTTYRYEWRHSMLRRRGFSRSLTFFLFFVITLLLLLLLSSSSSSACYPTVVV
jgi:hypothetical protein